LAGFDELLSAAGRLGLNNPPTVVGGIRRVAMRLLVGWNSTIHQLTLMGFDELLSAANRLELNNPPTVVGGIRRVAMRGG
jgi:hypothetical protein